MKLSGTATVHAPVDRVYAALTDPAVLVRTIPGCEQLELVGDDAYRMTVTAGVASIKGAYVGDVRLTDRQEPHSFVLRASGSGAPGTVSADVTVALAGDGNGGTSISYDANAVVGGMIGGVGQRVLAGVAKRTAAEFFAAVDGVLNGGVPATEAPVAASGTPATVAETGTGAETPTVYRRPAAPAGMTSMLPGGDFMAGALFGAGLVALGAVIGGFIAARARRR